MTTTYRGCELPGGRSYPALIHYCLLLAQLWCVYELAAYTAHEVNDDGSNLIFLSPLKAPAVLLMSAITYLWPLLEYLNLRLAPVEEGSTKGLTTEGLTPVPIGLFCMLMLFTGISSTVLFSGRERASVLRRLDGFSVAAGKCFSEDDRAYIQDKICSWYAQGGELARKRLVTATARIPHAHSVAFATTTVQHLRHEAELIRRFESEVHRGGRIYKAVERMVGVNRSGLSLLDVCHRQSNLVSSATRAGYAPCRKTTEFAVADACVQHASDRLELRVRVRQPVGIKHGRHWRAVHLGFRNHSTDSSQLAAAVA